MDWGAPIDIYCERIGPGFWSEPVNAVSNLAFLIAAWAAARDARSPEAGSPDGPVLALAALVAVIGIGSFLFHTLANRWSVLADTIPIAGFVLGYLLLAFRRFFRMAWPGAVLGLGAYLVVATAVEALVPRGFLNGSAGYLPAWAAMIGIGLILHGRGSTGARLILTAAAIFTLSLAFRSADQAVCPSFPAGLHYFWHGLNAVTLYLLLRAARQRRLGPGGCASRPVSRVL